MNGWILTICSIVIWLTNTSILQCTITMGWTNCWIILIGTTACHWMNFTNSSRITKLTQVYWAMQLPFPKQTEESVWSNPLQVIGGGTSHANPIYPPVHWQVSGPTQIPCELQAVASIFPKQTGKVPFQSKHWIALTPPQSMWNIHNHLHNIHPGKYKHWIPHIVHCHCKHLDCLVPFGYILEHRVCQCCPKPMKHPNSMESTTQFCYWQSQQWTWCRKKPYPFHLDWPEPNQWLLQSTQPVKSMKMTWLWNDWTLL